MKILWFDGKTYDPERDGLRLTTQLFRVFSAMTDGRWHTLAELADKCGGSEAAVSARIRDLRKKKFGHHNVEHEFVSRGKWKYRLILPAALVPAEDAVVRMPRHSKPSKKPADDKQQPDLFGGSQ